MTDDSEDGPSFVRQRRNVMVACLVVLTVLVLQLQYKDVKVLDVTAGAPQNFDIAWAGLLLYFVWRLSQCEKPYNIISEPDGYYRSYINDMLPTHSELIESMNRALEIANEKLTSTKHVQSRNPQTGQIEDWKATDAICTGVFDLHPLDKFTIYKLGFNVKTLDPTNDHPVVLDRQLSHKTFLARWAWTKAYAAASWKGQYFSEYVLPFVLGFTCIMYCVAHHFSNH